MNLNFGSKNNFSITSKSFLSWNKRKNPAEYSIVIGGNNIPKVESRNSSIGLEVLRKLQLRSNTIYLVIISECVDNADTKHNLELLQICKQSYMEPEKWNN